MENQMQNPAPMGEEGNKMNPWIAILIVIVLVVIGYFLFKSYSGSIPSDNPANSEEEVFEGKVTQAEEGEVVSDFPPELLLEDGVTLGSSYSIAYSGGNSNQPVVNYDSKLSLSENIELFGNYLEGSDWNVTVEADPESDLPFFYAEKENETLNITFEEDESGVVNVNIAYWNQASE